MTVTRSYDPRDPMNRSCAIFGLLACAGVVHGCGDDGPTPDAGDGQNRLEILEPPGDSIGLAFSASESLRVRYLSPSGDPIAGASVEFGLQVGANESSGASALSAATATTDSAGIAQIEVTAGVTDANFRVRATADRAAPATFFVVVSDTGFASFQITPTHGGPRLTTDYINVEVRLFSPDQLDCATLDIDELPESVFPPRSIDGFVGDVLFQNLAAARPYVLVLWAEGELGGSRLAVGCVELTAEQVRVGPALQMSIDVTDRPLLWATPVAITSAVVLPDLDSAADAVVAPDPWRVVRCDLGAAQLVVDCSLDSAIPDGALDCVVNGSDPLIDAFENARGALANGCRPDEQSPGVPSLDRAVLDAMSAGPWTEANALGLAIARDQIIGGARLTSELSMPTTASARHRLLTLTMTAGAESRETDLTASARPVLEASATAAVDDSGRVVIGDHGFTLDFERAADEMFALELLPAFGLDGRRDDLGAALIDSFESGGDDDCAAISAVACAAAGEPATCIEAACAAVGPALDARLLAWIAALGATDIDFSLTGAATIADVDFDRQVDRVGGAAELTGMWVVEVITGDGPQSGAAAFGGGQ